jgi:hypothetical protein
MPRSAWCLVSGAASLVTTGAIDAAGAEDKPLLGCKLNSDSGASLSWSLPAGAPPSGSGFPENRVSPVLWPLGCVTAVPANVRQVPGGLVHQTDRSRNLFHTAAPPRRERVARRTHLAFSVLCTGHHPLLWKQSPASSRERWGTARQPVQPLETSLLVWSLSIAVAISEMTAHARMNQVRGVAER